MSRTAAIVITLVCALGWASPAVAETAETDQSVRVIRDYRWSSRGWMKLGLVRLDGKSEHATMEGKLGRTRFAQLALRSTGADFDLADVLLTHADDRAFSPDIRHHFRDGERTVIITLTPERQLSKSIKFTLGADRGGGKGVIEVWGWPADQPPPRQPAIDPWSEQGWTFLGDAKVISRRGRDTVRLRPNQGSYTRIVLVIEGGDLEVSDARFKARRGPPVDVSVGHRFRDGATSREIELPSAQDRIQWIELRHRDLPRNGKTRVKIYAR
jgi:hypothetical protein